MTKYWLSKNKHIIVGLKDVVAVFLKSDYKILGSLIPSALNGAYRKMGDIDIIADRKVKDKVIKGFKQRGYRVILVKGLGNLLGIVPIRFSKAKTKIDVFFGQVESKGWWLDLKMGFRLLVPLVIWDSGFKLKFNNIEFSGISPSAAFYVISTLEAKKTHWAKTRSKDLLILAKHVDFKEVAKIKSQQPGLWFKNIYFPVNNFIAKVGTIFQVIEDFILKLN